MSDTPWVKWYASDFLNGVAALGPAEAWVYTVILNLIYDAGGPIEDDGIALARRCNMRPTSCEKALDVLVAKRKIIRKNGRITNERAEKEIKSRRKVGEKSAENANTRWKKVREKSNEINNGDMRAQSEGISQDDAYQSPEARDQIETEQGGSVSLPEIGGETDAPPNEPVKARRRAPAVSDADTRAAVDAWNEVAGRLNLKPVEDVKDARLRNLAARLKETGLEGWNLALSRIERSSWLLGKNEKSNWQINFTWLVLPSNFTKVREGNYDDRPSNGPRSNGRRPTWHEELSAEFDARGVGRNAFSASGSGGGYGERPEVPAGPDANRGRASFRRSNDIEDAEILGAEVFE